ncbi:MAG: DUF3142 domain-containing protein [Rubrivivax sp.]|nr:DUF3142 domain-containing protein [Pyrinomonadaceae bacterium]
MLGLFRRRRAAGRLLLALAGLLMIPLATAAWRWAREPRVWRPGEAAVAFWTWRAGMPSQEDVARAAHETGARLLFVRAGQFDFASGRVARIRAAQGEMPRGVELHLVYNATPALLAEFERIDEKTLAEAFVETFRADAGRAASEGADGSVGAKVSGLQLDLDVPTRLLARYGRVLAATRAMLPEGARLSVTGLETWMEAGNLRAVLESVDFWLPQFYGAEIPATADKLIPISSPGRVAKAVARARELGKPFYAGLAVYSYALLYSEKGKLLELRGDIDPARVASDRNFELVERRAFESRVLADGAAKGAPLASEWRYVFRARGDTSLEGLVVRAGEQIVIDVPSSESLRASVRGVREGAGEKLLGICLFRLPTRDDRATLSLAQIAAALADRDAEGSTRVVVETPRDDGGEKISGQVLLTAENDGEAGALFGDDALAVTLRVPRGSVRGVTRLEGFDSFEALCESAVSANEARGSNEQATLRPCSAARASFIRLKSRGWPAGARARVGLSFDGETPSRLSATVAVRRDDGRVWERSQSVSSRGVEGR